MTTSPWRTLRTLGVGRLTGAAILIGLVACTDRHLHRHLFL